ncbi:Protein DSF2 [Sphaceloma murrayae]|uniref:Protein DSF2 n=1 Tax=Sphaceloma murrayae TaxID=2082308 RepID=A0A2K1QU60_9PEZI|nr:Protein DSF2 [Sphaceloma murrayae]
MTLRDLLRKKHDIEKNGANGDGKSTGEKAAPYQTEFTFLRTTTSDQEVIQPPSFPGDQEKAISKSTTTQHQSKLESSKRRRSLFHPHKDASPPSGPPQTSIYNDGHRPTSKESSSPSTRPKNERKLSDRFSQIRLTSRSASRESASILPSSLDPAPSPIPAPLSPDVLSAKKSNPIDSAVERAEAEWEARAAALALSSSIASAASPTPSPEPTRGTPSALISVASAAGSIAGSSAPSTATSPSRTPEQQKSDEETLQKAITLHETGDLPASTALFSQLASPTGANSALAQVLYGLALRHGWGTTPDPGAAVHFLSLAAKNSASIEKAALKAGMARGGDAKGELVLAIFELANCYRYGWGVGVDARAAREFYVTAANLGDLDAMEEAAWCWTEGFGGPKGKFEAAQYLRRAEEGGRKRVGESWIWKEKYNPKSQ